MNVKIDKYKLHHNNGNYWINDCSEPKHLTICDFNSRNKETNKKLAELCLAELNTGKYEESETS